MSRRLRFVVIALFAVAAVLFIGSIVLGATGDPLKKTEKSEPVHSSSEAPAVVETAETTPSEPSEPASTSPSTPSAPAAVKNQAVAPQSPSAGAAGVPEKTEPINGGHVPFTNKPVTPGDPASYVDTVGQCPFYEMGGDKGCVPPPDIECNADWSVCTYKGE